MEESPCKRREPEESRNERERSRPRTEKAKSPTPPRATRQTRQKKQAGAHSTPLQRCSQGILPGPKGMLNMMAQGDKRQRRVVTKDSEFGVPAPSWNDYCWHWCPLKDRIVTRGPTNERVPDMELPRPQEVLEEMARQVPLVIAQRWRNGARGNWSPADAVDLVPRNEAAHQQIAQWNSQPPPPEKASPAPPGEPQKGKRVGGQKPAPQGNKKRKWTETNPTPSVHFQKKKGNKK